MNLEIWEIKGGWAPLPARIATWLAFALRVAIPRSAGRVESFDPDEGSTRTRGTKNEDVSRDWCGDAGARDGGFPRACARTADASAAGAQGRRPAGPIDSLQDLQDTGRMIFKLADENNDGQISQKEAIDAGNLLVGGFFFRADQNGDGVLSQDEARQAREAFLSTKPWLRYAVETAKSQVEKDRQKGDTKTATQNPVAMTLRRVRHQQRQAAPGHGAPPGRPDGRPERSSPPPTPTATVSSARPKSTPPSSASAVSSPRPPSSRPTPTTTARSARPSSTRRSSSPPASLSASSTSTTTARSRSRKPRRPARCSRASSASWLVPEPANSPTQPDQSGSGQLDSAGRRRPRLSRPIVQDAGSAERPDNLFLV